MSRIVQSKSKLSRKYGVSLWDRPNDAFKKKAYIPGQHGGKVMRVMKTYRRQLVEKNKIRFYHMLTERQFRNIVMSSIQSRFNSIETMISTLNTLLSTVIFSSGLVPTIFFAKQLVSHGHVLVNGKRLDIGTYKVKVGDVITLTDRAKNMSQILAYLESTTSQAPNYMKVDRSNIRIELTRKPEIADIQNMYKCEISPSAVIEYYSG